MKIHATTCDEMVELFSLHLDNELDEVGTSRMRRHLTSCTDCGRLLSQMQALDLLFQQAPMKYAPMGFTERAVTAAFDAELRRNLRFGLAVLMVGTLLISSLILMGRADLLWAALSVLFAPGFFSNSAVWLSESMQALAIAGRVGLGVLGILRGLLVGPLLIPSLLSLLSAAFVALVLRRQEQGASRLV